MFIIWILYIHNVGFNLKLYVTMGAQKEQSFNFDKNIRQIV